MNTEIDQVGQDLDGVTVLAHPADGSPTAAEPATPATPPLVRRRRRLLAVIAAMLLIAVAGFFSPMWIKSPQQIAAEAKPPSPTVLTAAVEQRVLRDTVVLRGDVKSQYSLDVTPGSGSDGRSVVTSVKVAVGDQVKAGTAVLEVSGRPLIVLPGAVPAYRDLKPGATGKDVAQLQAALAELGFPPSERDGVFGPGTKQALTAFYASRGYTPLPVSDNDARQVADAQKQVTMAERQVADARDALATVQADPAATTTQRADAAKALTRSQEDLTAAREQLAEVKKTTGPMLPQSEYAFLPAFPARVEALKATIGSAVSTPLITFSTGDLVVKATLTEAQRALCKPGQTAQISGDQGLAATGTIASVGELAAPTAADDKGGGAPQPSGYPIVITPSSKLDTRFAGLNIRLTIEVASSQSPQLAVPVSAIYAGADGAVYVTKRAPDGREERVKVQPGMSAEGYVAITATTGQLNPGDLVTVGAS